MLDDLALALRASLVRLERLGPAPADSPMAELQLATLLHSQAGLLSAIAGELEARAHEELGRFGAQVVELACRAADPETAACEVGGVPRTSRRSRQKFAVTPPSTRRPITEPPNSWNRC
jgi:hypothetical protein